MPRSSSYDLWTLVQWRLNCKSYLRVMKAPGVDYYRDLITAADPGFNQLRMGARACLTAVFASLSLIEIARLLHKPATDALIGAVIAISGSALVNDPDPKQQKITMLIVPFLASASITAGTLSAPEKWLGRCLFLCVIFGAVFARRFGPRYSTLGFVAFLSFFYALYFHAHLAQAPWTICAILFASAIGFAVRFLLIPDRPGRILDRLIRAFQARLRIVLSRLARMLIQPWHGKRDLRAIRKQITRLNQVGLALESQSEGNEDWRTKIFEIELATQTLADAVRTLAESSPFPEERNNIAQVLLSLRGTIRRDSRSDMSASDIKDTLARMPAHPGNGDAGDLHLAHWKLEFALRDLVQHEPWKLTSDPERPPGQPNIASQTPNAGSPANAQQSNGFLAAIRQPAQATLAGGLAIVAGSALSPSRWYWAVIAAFVVFSRATTSGETLSRAWQRIAGTAIGVGAALFVADKVNGHTNLELALLFAGIFAAYYFLRAAYAWFIFIFTMLLAILYSLLGRYTPELLYLRLEETLIGGAIGTAVAFFVFPSHTTTKIHASMAEVLDGLAGLLEVAACQPVAVSDLRDLERKFQQLLQAASPISHSAAPFGSDRMKSSLQHILIAVYCTRHLARSGIPGTMSEATRNVIGNARAIAETLRGQCRKPVRADLDTSRHDDANPVAEEFLERMNQALLHLADSLGYTANLTANLNRGSR